MTLSEAYLILSINQNCSLEELKKRYRTLSKKWHPDVNKSEDAHDVFVKLNHAFHTVLKEKEEPYSYKGLEKDYKDYVDKNVEKYSKTSFYEFENSSYFKSNTNFKTVLFHVQLFLLASAFMFVFYLFYTFLSSSILLSIATFILMAILSYSIFQVFRQDTFDLKAFFQATLHLDFTEYAYLGVICFFYNLIAFTKFYYYTFLSSHFIILTYLLFIALGLIYFYKKIPTISSYIRVYYSVLCVPMILSTLIMINYFFSFYIHTEQIQFYSKDDSFKGSILNLNLKKINFQGNKYESFPGIRTFSYKHELEKNGVLNLDIGRGLFGLKVIKSYKIEPIYSVRY